jgi:hypothetical protein
MKTYASDADKFRLIPTFEFFLWSDIRPQSNAEYIKERLAEAVGGLHWARYGGDFSRENDNT